MDLETENRLAALLMREAAELRRQADQEGVLAYLREPNKRHRPNSRFLTATVLGVQQCRSYLVILHLFIIICAICNYDKSSLVKLHLNPLVY